MTSARGVLAFALLLVGAMLSVWIAPDAPDGVVVVVLLLACWHLAGLILWCIRHR